MRVALQRDATSYQLLEALLRGTTLTACTELTGWDEHTVRRHFHAIAREMGRKLIHQDETFRLGAIQKSYDSRRP